MKKFIWHISTFVLTGVLILFLVIGSLFYLMSDEKYYKIPDNVELLFLGDSHSECAFNDTIIENSLNLSHSGEAYFYTYIKTKKLLKSNPNIKAVFVAFNLGQVIKPTDENIWGDVQLGYRFSKYAHCMNLQDYFVLFRNNFKSTLNGLSIAYKRTLTFLSMKTTTIIPKNAYDWGGFAPLHRSDTAKLNSLNIVELKYSDKVLQRTEINIYYLEKLIRFCEERGVNIFLVRLPVHEKYYGRNNEKTLDFVYNKHFKETPFLDYIDFPIENIELADIHHLNYLGVNWIFIKFKKKQNNNVFGKLIDVYSKLFKQKKQIAFYLTLPTEIENKNIDIFNTESRPEFDKYATFIYKGIEIFTLLTSVVLKLTENNKLNSLHKDDLDRLFKIKKLLTSNFNERISINELSKNFAISPSKLKRDFKALFNSSIYHFQLINKMEEAYRRLQKEDFTVSQVGYDMGYSNLSKFSEQFKNIHGINPSEVVSNKSK